MEEKLLEIINHYGVNKQLKQFNEESYELIEAITAHENVGLQEQVQHIAEEIADCQVMLEQFRLYYGIEQEEIEKIMNEKIDRQIERIKREEQIMKRKFLRYQVRIEGISATIFYNDKVKTEILTKLDNMNKEYGYENVAANNENQVFISGDIVQNTKAECKAIHTLAKRDILSILKEYGATKVSMNAEGYGVVI